MVTTPSIAADHEAKRQRLTLEKTKVVNLSKQLQIRLQYARLKVEHGWQRQSLNEVENLYFHHSTLKGKSKASRTLSSSARAPSSLGARRSPPSTPGGPSPKVASGSSRTTKGRSAPEPNQAAAPVSAASSPPTVIVALSSPHDTPPSSQLSTPAKSSSSYNARGTPTPTQASLSPSVLSTFTQSIANTQQQLSRETTATIDFSSLSPFVTPSSFSGSGSGSSITAPSSFVAIVPPSSFPQQTLAYVPSPFAPPSSTSTSTPFPPAPPLPMSQFAAEPTYPVAVPTPDMSASLSTFLPAHQAAFSSLVQTHHSPSPSPTPPTPTPAPIFVPTSTPALVISPALAPALPPLAKTPPSASKRTRTSVPAAAPPAAARVPAQKPSQPASASTHPPAMPLSSFRTSKTFDIPTAPGPAATSVGTGAQSTTPLLTYDSFWSTHHSSAVGGWRRALASGSGSDTSTSIRSAAVLSGIAASTPASSTANSGGSGLGSTSAKA